MYFVDCEHPPGTVVIVSNELSRYSDFSISLVRLKAPVGTIMYWQKGVEIVKGINHGIRNMQGEWVWILGDDHTFHGEVLLHLLNTQKDIIVPLCAKRDFPHYPVTYPKDTGTMYLQAPWSHIKYGGMMEVDGNGSAGMLIRKPVLDAIGDPWFEAGKMDGEHISEDLYFCRKAREKGFKVHVDTRQAIGHITPATIIPVVLEGNLVPVAVLNGDERMMLRMDQGLTTRKNVEEKPDERPVSDAPVPDAGSA
jgi:hypothetical protein